MSFTISSATAASSGGVQERPKVLVVDDEPSMLRAVERILRQDFAVSSYASPIEALRKAATLRPKVAIVDVQMAGMDGFELTRALKELDPQVRVILMTGSVFATDKKLIRAIQEQAFYFIHKPFDREVLRILVDRCLELRALEDANQRHVSYLESQIAEARAFQRAMLPASAARILDQEIHTAFLPSTDLAGDLCDYAYLEDRSQVTVLIADVVGHGASAAMMTALVKSAFRASLVDDYDPLAIVLRVSESLAAFEASRFVTLLAVRLDIDNQQLEYVNAGHDGGVLAPDGEPPIALVSSGPLISPALARFGLGWQRRSLPWRPGARLLLYSDGITEAECRGEELGVERLRELFVEGGHGAALLRNILDRVEAFSPGAASDDRTLLTVRWDHGSKG